MSTGGSPDVPLANAVVAFKAVDEEKVRASIKRVEGDVRAMETSAVRSAQRVRQQVSQSADAMIADLRAGFAESRARLDRLAAAQAGVRAAQARGLAIGGAAAGVGGLFLAGRAGVLSAERVVRGQSPNLIGSDQGTRANLQAAADYAEAGRRGLERIAQNIGAGVGSFVRAIDLLVTQTDHAKAKVIARERAARGRGTVIPRDMADELAEAEDRVGRLRNPIAGRRYLDAAQRFLGAGDQGADLSGRIFRAMLEGDIRASIPSIRAGFAHADLFRRDLQRQIGGQVRHFIGLVGAGAGIEMRQRDFNRAFPQMVPDERAARQERIERGRIAEQRAAAQRAGFVARGRRLDELEERALALRDQLDRRISNVRSEDVTNMIQEAIRGSSLDEVNRLLEQIRNVDREMLENEQQANEILGRIDANLARLNVGVR